MPSWLRWMCKENMSRELYYLDTEPRPSWLKVSPETLSRYNSFKKTLNRLLDDSFMAIVSPEPMNANPLEYARQLLAGIPDGELEKLAQLHPDKILDIYLQEKKKRAEKASQQLWKKATNNHSVSGEASATHQYIQKEVLSQAEIRKCLDLLSMLPQENRLPLVLEMLEEWQEMPNDFTRSHQIQEMILRIFVYVVAVNSLSQDELAEFAFRQQPNWEAIPREPKLSRTAPIPELPAERLTEPVLIFFDHLRDIVSSISAKEEFVALYGDAIVEFASSINSGRTLAYMEKRLAQLPPRLTGSNQENRIVKDVFGQGNAIDNNSGGKNPSIDTLRQKEDQLIQKVSLLIQQSTDELLQDWKELDPSDHDPTVIDKLCSLYSKEEKLNASEKRLLQLALQQALSALPQNEIKDKTEEGKHAN